jgi:hypothetical protein
MNSLTSTSRAALDLRDVRLAPVQAIRKPRLAQARPPSDLGDDHPDTLCRVGPFLSSDAAVRAVAAQ